MYIRHETPVLDHPIKIIHIDNDLVVLDKPSSVPVSSWQKWQSTYPLQIRSHDVEYKNFQIMSSEHEESFVVVVVIVWIDWRAKKAALSVAHSFCQNTDTYLPFEITHYFIPFNTKKSLKTHMNM